MNFFKPNMIIYKTEQEIEIMRQAAQVVSRTLGKVAEKIGPGVTPKELDTLAEAPWLVWLSQYAFDFCKRTGCSRFTDKSSVAGR
jgi:methionine aminopeptidase